MMDVFAPQPPGSSLTCGICRCPGGPGGTVHQDRAREAESERYQTRAELEASEKKAREAEIARLAVSPKIDQYVIERVEQVGQHLVMQVRYPNCTLCAYEGLKTMVFLNTSPIDALKWRQIDPHFKKTQPSPSARFPSSAEGWMDACNYARGKVR